MRIILFTLAAFFMFASTSQAQSMRPSRSASTAILRGLDKISAKTRDFKAKINEEVKFGTLSITVRYCRKTPPEEEPEIYVYMNVTDRRTDGTGQESSGEDVFSGWMFASNPALNAIEHPVYDVWVLDCTD